MSEFENEKMAALKSAYAEIMLNTAKESAARILASEKKALMYQKSFFDAKEEALSMLMRLKSVMDGKIKEAELKSLNQDKKIMELELQLNEAENIIMDLREKLERAENESKRNQSDLIKPTNEKKVDDHAASNSVKCQESQPSPDSIGSPHVELEVASPNTISSKDSNPDLASFILKSKEPDLYRNGCTQRIHAIEHNAQSVDTKAVHISGGYKYEFECSFRKPRTKCIALNKKENVESVLGTTESITEERPLKLLKSHSAPFSSTSSNDSDDKGIGLSGGLGLVQCSNSNRTANEQANVKPNDGNHVEVNDLKLSATNHNMEGRDNDSDMKVDASLVHSNTKVGTKGNEKIYKYTFQRKRKRGSSCAKTISPEKVLTPSLGTRRDDRRTVQVARQLISLSEKKW